ncbi:unnamed protein product [Closterium sp. NIES-54]
MGEVGDASVFRVWGSRAFVRDTSSDKISARDVPYVFLGFPPDAPSWQFYHPTSRRVFPSQDVTFDESVPIYCLFPYRSAPPPPRPLFLALGPPPVEPLPPQGPAPSGVSQVDPLSGTVPVEVAVGSGAARGAASGGAASGGVEPGGAESESAGFAGAEPGGAEPRGAEPGGAEPGGAEHQGVEPGGAEFEGAESGGAEPRGTASSGGPTDSSPRLSPQQEPLSPQQLCEWFAQHTRLRSGAPVAGDSAAGDTGAGGVGATRIGGAGVTAGAGGTRVAAAGPGGARTRGIGAAGSSGVGGAGAGGAGAGDPAEPGGAGAGGTSTGGVGVGGAGAGDIGAVGARDVGIVRPRPYFVPLFQQPASPLPAPSPYTEQTGGLRERREPESHPASPVRAVRTSHRVPRPHPPPVPGTHVMALRPSSTPLRVPLPPLPECSLLAVPNPESVGAHAASPTVVTDPSFESTAVSALLSASASPPSVGGECALDTDVLEDKKEDLECLAAAVPRFAPMLLALEGGPNAPDIPTPRSYAEAITGMGLVLGGRGPVVLTGHADASWVDDSPTQRLSQGYTFSLGSGSVSWRSTRSSSVLSSSCEAEIYSGAMAAYELRWLTYLLTDLGEQPRSPPILYVDNKAIIALCQEHRLEHRTKHIALRYFLARELQQRGQLRLAYVATKANTADIFTKALPPGDHQRFCAVLGLVPTLPHLLTT